MLTGEDIDYLLRPEVRSYIDRNIAEDPVKIALRRDMDRTALVAGQIKYLRKAQKKLPDYYRCRCIMLPVPYEQASAAAVTSTRNYSGRLCIDLSCGLGSDSLALSRTFRQVIAVERDPLLARVTAENFRLMGVKNVEVVNALAEDFLDGYTGAEPDVVFVDPDRRDDTGDRLLLLQDCSPDVLAIRPIVERWGARLVVKLSPLFDVSEAFRIFGPQARVSAVSWCGECKEITVETGKAVVAGVIRAVIAGRGEVEYPRITNMVGDQGLKHSNVDGSFAAVGSHEGRSPENPACEGPCAGNTVRIPSKADAAAKAVAAGPGRSGERPPVPSGNTCTTQRHGSPADLEKEVGGKKPGDTVRCGAAYKYIVVPDVALVKAGITGRYFAECGLVASGKQGCGFGDVLPAEVYGTIFEIKHMAYYSPSALRRWLRSRGIKKAWIIRRDFPYSARRILKDLSIGEGDGNWLIFTRLAGEPVMVSAIAADNG